MPIRHAIWTVGNDPAELREAQLPSEALLEAMICAKPAILSDAWMLIGRQENTGFGGRIDLLAIAPDGTLILIELKRGRTPREVVAQALDYAVWVERLRPGDIEAIYARFRPQRDFRQDFRNHFGAELDEEDWNGSHQIIVVAESIDASSERIVGYLSDRGIAINVLCFQIFQDGDRQFLSRAWLIDPVEAQANAVSGPREAKEPWNGEFYANFAHGETRSWDEATRYGFLSAGGGRWYSNSLRMLSPGDRVWTQAPGYGYVGVGKVTGIAQPISEFRVSTSDGEKPASELLTLGNYHRHVADEDEVEWFVPIAWSDTVPIQKAFKEPGLFGNQNTVCKPATPKWRHTVERLRQVFPKADK